jgi:hypothetical protein
MRDAHPDSIENRIRTTMYREMGMGFWLEKPQAELGPLS